MDDPVRMGLVISVRDCTVCGDDHARVQFIPDGDDHVGTCPARRENNVIRMKVDPVVYRRMLSRAGGV